MEKFIKTQKEVEEFYMRNKGEINSIFTRITKEYNLNNDVSKLSMSFFGIKFRRGLVTSDNIENQLRHSIGEACTYFTNGIGKEIFKGG